MSNIHENEYNALVDALKNMTDIVAVLSNKINVLDDEILKLKKNNLSLEDTVNKINDKVQHFKIKSMNFSNIELKTDEEIFSDKEKNMEKKTISDKEDEQNQYYEENDEQTTYPIITDPTTIGETDINNLRKNKAVQIIDKLIQKKKEIANLNQNNDVIDNNEITNNKQNIISKRKNKIMRRF